MDDNISRKAALGAVSYETFECYEARKAIRALPSTDRKGHWKIYNHVDRMGNPIGVKICVCDQCKETVTLSWRAKVPNFCQHCGADMRGVDDESTL